MYDTFYGLQGRPFQLTPDPHYYFESATHRKALSYLGYGLAQGEGFIVITGDIGAGKTTLVGHLMQTIDPARLTAVKIVSTQVEGDDMLRLAAQSFGLPVEGQPKAQILRQIESWLHGQARAGRRTLLIVDEAQNLPVSAIEELRMLSNFQLGGQSLLQIFLLGQPEFRDLLKSPRLEQLHQRVIATHHLEPMMAQEVEPYIQHRLSIAGWTGNPHFTARAFAALYSATDGVPRRVNALTSRVLLMGAIEQLSVIDADTVLAVVADMGMDSDAVIEPVAASPLDEVEEAQAAPVEEAAPEPEPQPEPAFEPEIEIAAEAEAEAEPEPAPEPQPERRIDAHLKQAAQAVVDDSIAENADMSEEDGEEEFTEEFGAAGQAGSDDDQPRFARPADTALASVHEEIVSLRAEIASLRAAQARASFAQPAAETVDADALKEGFRQIEERLAGLEFRVQEQDGALRRVLTLLIDWVEREDGLGEDGSSAAA